MSYGFKEFAIEVLQKLGKPLDKMEIWAEGQKLGLDKKLGTEGKTPWHSIGAQIYTEIKNSEHSRFKQVSKRPALFALTEQEFSEKFVASRSAEAEESVKETKYNERSLHPVLVKYLVFIFSNTSSNVVFIPDSIFCLCLLSARVNNSASK